MTPEIVMRQRDMLIAQCPSLDPPVTEAVEALPLHVTTWGESGSKVLLIHGGVQGGIGGGPVTFDRQRALAERGWTVARVDRPGFGESPSRGIDDMAADAIWIERMLGDGAHLIGHSWGGAEALLAAARRPAAVRSLILVEPALFPLVMTQPDVLADPMKREAAMHVAKLMMSSRTPADYGLAFARSLGSGTDAGGAANVALAALEADPSKAAKLGCALLQGRMASPQEMLQAAAAIAAAGVPILTISGGWSPFFDLVSQVTAKVAGGSHVIVPSSTHFPQMENPGDFNELVEGFMRDAEAR